MEEQLQEFKRAIWSYYKLHKRDFPWRRTVDPYRIVVSEIMLQQTQTERVVPKYRVFVKQFPSFRAVAKVPLDEILRAWQGLGYNRRAIALKKLSRVVVEKYHGTLPHEPLLLKELPGIGRATAGSIAAFAFNKPAPFIETNIRRVFIHFFFPTRGDVRDEEILELVERTIDTDNPREWFFALMDYGAMLGRSGKNPNRKSVHYRTQSRFQGSNRELRGNILKLLINRGPLTKTAIVKYLSQSQERVIKIFPAMEREGFIRARGKVIHIAH